MRAAGRLMRAAGPEQRGGTGDQAPWASEPDFWAPPTSPQSLGTTELSYTVWLLVRAPPRVGEKVKVVAGLEDYSHRHCFARGFNSGPLPNPQSGKTRPPALAFSNWSVSCGAQRAREQMYIAVLSSLLL